MRAAILNFLKHHGITPTKYHETLTHAWILAVFHFMHRTPSALSADDFIDRTPLLLHSRIMLTHYSAERLFSQHRRVRHSCSRTWTRFRATRRSSSHLDVLADIRRHPRAPWRSCRDIQGARLHGGGVEQPDVWAVWHSRECSRSPTVTARARFTSRRRDISARIHSSCAHATVARDGQTAKSSEPCERVAQRMRSGPPPSVPIATSSLLWSRGWLNRVPRFRCWHTFLMARSMTPFPSAVAGS